MPTHPPLSVRPTGVIFVFPARGLEVSFVERTSRVELVGRKRLALPSVRVGSRYILVPAFGGFLLSAPLMRGLFFPADLYPYLAYSGATLFLTAVWALASRRSLLDGFLPNAFLWLAVSYGLSCFVAASPPDAIRGFLKHLMYFGTFLLASFLSKERGAARTIALLVALGGTIVALVGVLDATGVLRFPGASAAGQIMSTVQYPNALAAYMMFSSAVALTLISTTRSGLLKLVLSSGSVIQLLVFMVSFSRGGWVIFPLMVFVMFLGMPRAERNQLALHLCAVATSVLVVVRRFAEAIESKTPQAGLRYVLFGIGIAVFFEAALAVFGRALRSTLAPPVRRVLNFIGMFYVTVTFLAYLVALASQYSSGVAGIVSGSMLRAFMTIRSDDPSLLTRAFATDDALRLWLSHPILGGGAGAWNAWYHTVQRVLYWTTEVHNHFAQVLVETGIVGALGYAGVWAGLLYAAAKSVIDQRRQDPDGSPDSAFVWGLTGACIGLGLHSLMDFELSLPGVAVQLWAVMGVVFAQTSHAGDSEKLGVTVDRPRGLGVSPNVLAGSGVAALAGLTLTILSLRLYAGARYGSLGAFSLLNQDYYTAVQLYDVAQKYDPFSASYSVDKAQAYAAMGLLGNRADACAKALSEIERGERLEPFNLAYRLKEVEVLVSLGEIDRAVSVSKEIVSMVPLDVRVYEDFARLSIVRYLSLIRRQEGAEAQEGESGAERYLRDVLAIPEKLDSLKSSITGVYKERWNPAKLDLTPALNTYIGQAYYLKGDLEAAKGFLGKALKEKGRPAEAEVWMTAIRIMQDQLPSSGALMEVREVLKYYPTGAR